MYDVNYGYKFIFLACGYPFVPESFLKILRFPMKFVFCAWYEVRVDAYLCLFVCLFLISVFSLLTSFVEKTLFSSVN